MWECENVFERVSGSWPPKRSKLYELCHINWKWMNTTDDIIQHSMCAIGRSKYLNFYGSRSCMLLVHITGIYCTDLQTFRVKLRTSTWFKNKVFSFSATPPNVHCDCVKSDFTTDLGFNPGTFHGVSTEKPVSFRWISFALLSKKPVAMTIDLYGYD